MDQFQEGLSLELLDELARTDCPSTVQAVMQLCLRIDERIQQ